MSKLIDKLVNAAGGWENFLYETLRDVCEKVGTAGFTGEGADAIEEATEVLNAYIEKKNIANPVTLYKSSSDIVQKDTTDVSKVKDEVKSVSQPEESEAKPKEKPLLPPKAQRGVLNVDSYAGACQGELPIPAGHKMVNREGIYITTPNGLELGRASQEGDGQIRGRGVSGHVNLSGVFRLVFTDAGIGKAIMHYQIQQEEV